MHLSISSIYCMRVIECIINRIHRNAFATSPVLIGHYLSSETNIIFYKYASLKPLKFMATNANHRLQSEIEMRARNNKHETNNRGKVSTLNVVMLPFAVNRLQFLRLKCMKRIEPWFGIWSKFPLKFMNAIWNAVANSLHNWRNTSTRCHSMATECRWNAIAHLREYIGIGLKRMRILCGSSLPVYNAPL